MTGISVTPANLVKMSDGELEEFLQRQKNILKNQKIIEKLADRGQKIKEKLAAAESEISRRTPMVVDAAEQLEQMSLQESVNHGESSSPHRRDQFPDICLKFDKYEEHRDAKDKFKPFSTLKHSITIKPDNAAKWDKYPNLRAAPPIKEIPALSLRDSLEIAVLQQRSLRNLHMEDATKFIQSTQKKNHFPPPHQNTEEFQKYRDKKDDLDSDDDSVCDGGEAQISSGFEELD